MPVNERASAPAGDNAGETKTPDRNASTTSGTEKPSTHISPARLPTQVDTASGVRWDYNLGARILLPPDGRTYAYRVENPELGAVIILGENTTPRDTGESEEAAQKRILHTRQKFFMQLRVRVWVKTEGADTTWEPCVDDTWRGEGRQVMIHLPRGAVGDTIAWIPYAIEFARNHACRTTIVARRDITDLYAETHPHIDFSDPTPGAEFDTGRFYATYYLGLFYDDQDCSWQPRDFRQTGLHRTAGHILGVSPEVARPAIARTKEGPQIDGPYVCISTLSTMQAKFWNNPAGWGEVIRFLRESGFRVIDIDRNRYTGKGIVWNHIPNGAEDETGDRPFAERVRWLRGAAFFIGLSSGLSWLAHACGTPTVLISGFTNPDNEFSPTRRVWNPVPCNSCWHDNRLRFDTANFLWCPRHENTPRQFECSRQISPEQVIRAIKSMGCYEDNATTIPENEDPAT